MRITHASIDGVEYKINTDFRVALECQDLLNSSDVSEFEKTVGVIVMLFGEECPINEEAAQKASIFLRSGDEQSNEEPVLDYNQDWTHIYSAFRSQYGIDLDDEKLHYQQFVDLLKGMKNQVINDVVQLRTYDLSELKDLKQRKKVAEQKKKVELKQYRVSSEVSQSGFYKALKNK